MSLRPSPGRHNLCPNPSTALTNVTLSDGAAEFSPLPTQTSPPYTSATMGATCPTYNWRKRRVFELPTGQPCSLGPIQLSRPQQPIYCSPSDWAAAFCLPSPNHPLMALVATGASDPTRTTGGRASPGVTGPICTNWRKRYPQRHRLHLHQSEGEMGRQQCKGAFSYVTSIMAAPITSVLQQQELKKQTFPDGSSRVPCQCSL